MQVQTILNFVEPVKSFVYRRVSWADEASRPTLRVEVEHRKNSRPICSGCVRDTLLSGETWKPFQSGLNIDCTGGLDVDPVRLRVSFDDT